MILYTRIFGLFVFAMIAQWWWSTHGTIFGVAPQLLLVLTVAIAARYGPLWGMLLGFFWGLFLDVMVRAWSNQSIGPTLAIRHGLGAAAIRSLGVGPQCLWSSG